jgi:hypothetical protein
MPVLPIGSGVRNPGMVPFRGSLGGNPLILGGPGSYPGSRRV